MEGTRGAAATTLALLGLTASACTSSAHPSAGPTPSTPHESTAPTATSKPAPSTSDPVLALVSTYVGTLDDLRSDPTRPLDDIYQVAVAPEATAEASAIGRLRAQSIRQTGRSELVSASPGGSLPAATVSAPMSLGPSTVVVNACIDVGRVDAVDNSGKSVLPPARPRYLIEHLTVVNASFPDPAFWRVSQAPNTQAQACSG
jgi:hypothetical protein